jgi:hypothetical protein
MELLGAILLVPLLIGVPLALGARRRDGKGDPQQRDCIRISGSIVTTIVMPRRAEAGPIRHVGASCGCNTPGCTL